MSEAKPSTTPSQAKLPAPAAEAARPAIPPAPASDPALQACDGFVRTAGIDTTRSSWRTMLPKPPKLPFETARTYYWRIETDFGSIRVRLMPAVAPMHVSSTIYLATLGFYDGLKFHRVIPGFMAQGGCPLGNGTGGPGYQYDGEFSRDVRHDRPGLLSMANRGPGTDGCQFFLTFVPTPHLDGRHTIFGEVSEGMEALRALERRGSPGGATTEPLLIRKTTIEIE
jgi:cyclophilin family peptidyl-prolyl cis-trans isomerase